MGFLDLFRPKWKHSNWQVRADAVRDLDDGDPRVAVVARGDGDPRVRRIALKKIGDPSLLSEIARNDGDDGLRKTAAEMASDILIKQATGADAERAREALRKIESAADLAKIAIIAVDGEVRKAALARISDGEALAQVARGARDAALRHQAIGAIKDADFLRRLALHDTNREVALAALARIDDVASLQEIVDGAKVKVVRKAALARLGEKPEGRPTRPEVSPLMMRQARQLQLVRTVERMSSRSDWERLVAEVDEAWEAWQELGPMPAASDKEVAEDATLAERFKTACQKVQARHSAVDEAKHAGERRSAALIEETARRTALCERAEAIGVEDAPAQVEAVRAEWDALGTIASELRALGQRFQRAIDGATRKHELGLSNEARRQAEVAREETRRQKQEQLAEERRARDAERKQNEEADKKEQEQNRARLEELCAKLEEQVGGGDWKAMDRELKEAQSIAAGLGSLPRDGALRDRFQTARDKVVARIRELQEVKDWERWANVAKLEKLCVRIEALKEEAAKEGADAKKLAADLKLLQQEWKQIGGAPKDKSAALWQRFKGAADEVYGKTREHFTALDAERGENARKKIALCEQAEALADKEDTKENADALKKLQAEWKDVGPVPKLEADALWQRFRGACDRFFGRRKAHFEQKDEERTANLKKKEKLCEEAEEVAKSSDWREAVKVVKQIQADWKAIGVVPKANADELWKRFRAACDSVFERAKAAHVVDAAAKAEVEGEKKDAEVVQAAWRPATLADLLKASQMAAAGNTEKPVDDAVPQKISSEEKTEKI